MRHDKRAEDGTYRMPTYAESRHAKAREATQTRSGEFTHSREPRRQTVVACQMDPVPRFKNGRVNRSGYHPKVV